MFLEAWPGVCPKLQLRHHPALVHLGQAALGPGNLSEAMQPARLTLEWLGLTPGWLDGEEGVCQDALASGGPMDLNCSPGSAALSP